MEATFHKMGSTINTSHPPILRKFSTKKPTFRISTVAFSSDQQNPISLSTLPKDGVVSSTVDFKTLGACKLGISRFPDFEYNAQGGTGTGTGTGFAKKLNGDKISVSFDLETLYIPPLASETTRFLGLPLPPLLRIDIVPQLFTGSIFPDSGKVDLEFVAKFLFSVGSFYRAPPLLVKTVLTSEESKGRIRGGKGQRMNEQGECRLVGVATVDPIDDVFMNTFLGLPTECLANLNATISFS